ncbi:MAG: hypothetical protein V1915_01245 [Candidatus Bathyarchaeota archaeon]
MRNHDYLFFKYDLHRVIEAQEKAMYDEIDSVEGNRLLNTGVEELVGYFKEKYLLPAPKLFEDKITVDQNESKIDVSGDPNRLFFDRSEPFYITGTKVDFYIPYEGDKDLFECQPSTYSLNPPKGIVTDTDLILTFQTTDHNGDTIKTEFQRMLDQIKGYLKNIEGGATEFNNQIEDKIRARINSRREKIKNDQGLAASFGFPMRKREGALQTYVVPEVKRKIVPRMPEPTMSPSKPEPVLDMAEYERILQIVSNMVTVMERSPRAFVDMQEEDLRTHFLVQLNGQYEGQATGETFNASGKTDILIRTENKNIFIAECKFWKGEEYFKEAIDQLLGYTSWRDTKTAILLFNRNKNTSAVLAQISKIVETHTGYIKKEEYSSETGFRFVMQHHNDKERELTLTVLVFDVPTD